MRDGSYRKYSVYIGIALCTILLVFSVFAAGNFTNVLLKAKQTFQTSPKNIGGAINVMFNAIAAMLYLPHAILQVQLCLISVILTILVINSSKEPISAKGIAASAAVGAIIGISVVYYLMNAISLKP